MTETRKVRVSLTEEDIYVLEQVAFVTGRSTSDVIRDALGLLPLASELQKEAEQDAKSAAEEAAVERSEPYPCFDTTSLSRDCNSDGYYMCEGCARLIPREDPYDRC